MAGKGGDYDGWILRLIENAEDILYSYSEIEWLKFAAGKIEAYSGKGITKNQIDALSEYRSKAFELPESLGLGVVSKVRYRDDKGRWTKRVTDRKETRTVYRGAGNKFITSKAATEKIRAEIDALGVRKKLKTYDT